MNRTTLEQSANLWNRFDVAFLEAKRVAPNFERAKEMLWSKAESRRSASMPERLYLEYEQFLIATASLCYAQSCGELNLMGDWAMWALVEEPKEHFVQDIELRRLYDFRKCPEIFYSPGYEAASVIYFNGLYDYARKRVAFKEVCEISWPYAQEIFFTVMSPPPQNIHPVEVFLGCAMLTWAVRDCQEKAPSLAKLIEEQVSNQALPAELRGLFCLTLATRAGQFTGHSSAYWARRALTEFYDSLSNLDRAQMMVSVLNMERQGRTDAEAALAQMAIVRAESNHGRTLAATREAAQTVEYVTPYFVWAINMSASDLLLRGLQTWYCQGDDATHPDPNSFLFSMPFGETGSVLLCGNEKRELVRNTQYPLEGVSRKMMELLSTYTTVAGADNGSLPIPERYGFALEYVKGLSDVLHDGYCPDGLDVPGQPKCQLILPMEGHPIQGTQLAAWGRTWPIRSSLAEPRPDRVVKSVLIWCGDVYSGQMELEMVEAAFKTAGAQIQFVNPETSTPEEFLREYENSGYDVLWVASHGDLDHWSPHQIKLHLARDRSAVMLDDLWNCLPDGEGRRLLVLNVCDGARFGEPGLLPRIGLAAGLTGPTQATISHLWPVRSLPSAAFGAYLAHFVASGMSFFDAYCTTLLSLQKSAADVGVELDSFYGGEFQLVQSLKSSSANFSNIETWGSAAFFE